MAANEYYGSTLPPPRPAVSQQPSYLSPPPGPQRASSQPNIQYAPQQPYQPPAPYAGSPGAPPAYNSISSSPPKPQVHFAPTPQPQHRPNSFSGGARPSFAQQNYSPYHQSPLHQQSLAPYAPQQPQAYQHNYSQPPQPGAGQLQPYPQYRPSDYEPGYSSDPERHRRRHKKHHSHSRSRSRSRDGRPRRTSEASRSTNADGFIGAAGGGLIGDLIFPGLGTVGGALAGWLGGKKYGNERKHREDRRDRTQEKWEERWGKPRSGSRGGGGGEDLAYGDEYRDEKDGYARRGSYDERERRRRY